MGKVLTDNYKFVKAVDELAAEVYWDKKFYYLNIREVAELRNIAVGDVRKLNNKANKILRDRNKAWLEKGSLSDRAKNALVDIGYREYSELYKDVMSEKIDIETFAGVGHKIGVEIRRWCLKNKPTSN